MIAVCAEGLRLVVGRQPETGGDAVAIGLDQLFIIGPGLDLNILPRLVDDLVGLDDQAAIGSVAILGEPADRRFARICGNSGCQPSPQVFSKSVPHATVESVAMAKVRPRPKVWHEKTVTTPEPGKGASDKPSAVAAGLSRSVRFVP